MQTTIDQRFTDLNCWLKTTLPQAQFETSPLAGDASFRRYFRVHLPDTNLIAMDAPPDKENCSLFVAIGKIFYARGLRVPKILAVNLEEGFLLLEDLGDNLYFRILNAQNADPLYKQAINDLLTIQTLTQNQDYNFPPFVEIMREELTRFREWYLLRHLNLKLTANQEKLLIEIFEKLIFSAVQQPQVCVHRDYHSRNLLKLVNNQVGILDFQDAVWGPATYDLVSLIRDCYIVWPDDQVEQWALYYFQLANKAGILTEKNSQQFLRWFDWMGIQRHLKAIYIFARKFHRDGNANYLAEIPRTLNYVMTITAKYPEFKEFREFLVTVK